MPDDILEQQRAKAAKFKITGVDRGWTPANGLQNAQYDSDRPDKNCRYDWHTFENGDYCSIPSEFREIWNSARTSAYTYGYRTGKRFRTAMGSHELLIWREDNFVDHDATPVAGLLKRVTAYIGPRGHVYNSNHELLQKAPDDQTAHILLAMYLLSGARVPQNYGLFHDKGE